LGKIEPGDLLALPIRPPAESVSPRQRASRR